MIFTDLFRKIYQETTHKLMIFRNALREKNFRTHSVPIVSNEISSVKNQVRANRDSEENSNQISNPDESNYSRENTKDNPAENSKIFKIHTLNKNAYLQNNIDYKLPDEDDLNYSTDDTISDTEELEHQYENDHDSDEFIDDGIEYLNENR